MSENIINGPASQRIKNLKPIARYINGRSHPTTYWLIGLFLTPAFVLLLGFIEFKFEIFMEFKLAISGDLLEVLILLSRWGYAGLIFLTYVVIYVGTYRAARFQSGLDSKSLWTGLVGHFLLTLWILLEVIW